MGAVYEARHLLTERRVAIKLLHSDQAEKKDVRVRFEREARAAGRIDHENVCEVLDSGISDDGSRYLVMPLLSGESLKELIKKDSSLPFRRSIEITCQILDALSTAHERGVIHRDLKPGNIFLTSVGGKGDFVKILDFGVTKFDEGLQDGADVTSLTRTGAVLGTPCYMAPEQARGSKDIDGQVDIYAVGVILYEMLTGRRPIEGETYNEVLWHLWNAPVKPPSAYCSDISPELESIVLKSMSRSRDKRYRSAETMRRDLSAALETVGPESLRPPPPFEKGDEAETASLSQSADTLPAFSDEPSSEGDVDDSARTTETAHRLNEPRNLRPFGVAIGVVGLAAVAVLVFSYVNLGSGSSTSPEPLEPPPPTTEPLTSAKVLEPPSRVRINLEGVPEQSEVLVDGRAMSGPIFELDPSEKAVTIVVRADGFVPWERSITAIKAMSIDVALEPEKTPVDRDAGQRAAIKGGPSSPIKSTPLQPTQPRIKRDASTRPSFGPIETFGKVP